MDEKTHFSARLNAGLKQAIEDFKQTFEDSNDSILKNDKQILEALLDTANSKYAPYKDNSIKIKALEAEKEHLKSQIQHLKTEITDLQEQNKRLSSELNEAQKTKQSFEVEQKNVVLTKSDLPKPILYVLKKILTDKKAITTINRMIEKYGWSEITGKIGENELEDIKTVLRTALIASAIEGKTLPALGIRKKFYVLIDDFKTL